VSAVGEQPVAPEPVAGEQLVAPEPVAELEPSVVSEAGSVQPAAPAATAEPECPMETAAAEQPAIALEVVTESEVSEPAIEATPEVSEPAGEAISEVVAPASEATTALVVVTGAAEPIPAAASEASAPVEKPAKRRTRSRRSDRAKPAAAETVVAAAEVVMPEAQPSPEPESVEASVPAAVETPVVSEMPDVDKTLRVEPITDAADVAPEIVTEAAERPNIIEAPAVGVEIVSTEERQGVVYFTIRDLRNCNTVHNVTPVSARKLWSYAINQYLKRPIDPEKVTWRGDYGLWQVGRRAKKLRYDLVKRQPDGRIRAFYGVTADGMDEPWAQFLKDEDRTA